MQFLNYLKRMFAKLFQRKSAPTQILKITMLGLSGVGKTSLLAAVYKTRS
jgi:GTPase SAR1 family protein